jgi:hypothetical protein
MVIENATSVNSTAVNITGVPFYDGIIEGFLFIPNWFAQLFKAFGVYNVGFWIGILIFIMILGFLIFPVGDHPQ